MRTFKYIGLLQDGTRTFGITLGNNTLECMKALSKRGIYVVSLNRVFLLSKKFSTQELISFFRHMLFQIQCCVPILTAISTYISISKNITVQSVLGHVLYELEKGKSLYEAFSIEPRIFGYVIPSIMNSAEISSKLYESIASIIIYLEFQENIRKKIKKAALYPIFVLLVAIASFIFCITCIGPQISELVSNNCKHSFATQLCITMIPNNPYFIIIMLISAISFLIICPRRLLLHIAAKVPYLSTLIERIYEWHCCTILFISLRAKLDLTKSLQLIESIIEKTPYSSKFKNLLSDILCGEKLSTVISKITIFSASTIHSIKIAEENNELENIIQVIVQNQKEEINFIIKKLGMKVSITITLCAGILLITILLGVFYPLYSSINIFEQ